MVSSFIKQITEQEFQEQTLCPKNSLFINFENNQFKKGLTFSLTMQEQAIKYCQKLVTQSLSSLLVEEKYSFTVWVQDKNIESQETKLKSALSVINLELVTEDINLNDEVKIAPIEQQIPTKKVTKLYRGQTYEVEIPNHSIEQSTSTKKVTKLYRGQTYEVEIPDYSVIQAKVPKNQQKPH
jgi:hypothetical protein